MRFAGKPRRKPALPRLPEMWDGQAAARIVATLVRIHARAEKSFGRQSLLA